MSVLTSAVPSPPFIITLFFVSIDITAISAAGGCYPGAFGPTSPRVLLVHADKAARVQDVISSLTSTGSFAAIDAHDAAAAPPPAAKLAAYDAALVWTGPDFRYFSDPQAVGDALADFWDAGGAVVVASAANGWKRLGGRLADEAQGYALLAWSEQVRFHVQVNPNQGQSL